MKRSTESTACQTLFVNTDSFMSWGTFMYFCSGTLAYFRLAFIQLEISVYTGSHSLYKLAFFSMSTCMTIVAKHVKRSFIPFPYSPAM